MNSFEEIESLYADARDIRPEWNLIEDFTPETAAALLLHFNPNKVLRCLNDTYFNEAFPGYEEMLQAVQNAIDRGNLHATTWPSGDAKIAREDLLAWLEPRGGPRGFFVNAPRSATSLHAPTLPGGNFVETGVELAATTDPVNVESNRRDVAKARFAAQDMVVRETLIELGQDPDKVPRDRSGRAGLRSQVRALLVGKHLLFTGSKIFEKAWDRVPKIDGA